jgi:hypothetical protein
LRERSGCCLNKNTHSLSQRCGRWFKIIHTFFTKETAAALIPDDFLFMKKVAATLKNIYTCFEREVAAASTKIHILFLRDVAAGLKKYIHSLPKRQPLPQY